MLPAPCSVSRLEPRDNDSDDDNDDSPGAATHSPWSAREEASPRPRSAPYPDQAPQPYWQLGTTLQALLHLNTSSILQV